MLAGVNDTRCDDSVQGSNGKTSAQQVPKQIREPIRPTPHPPSRYTQETSTIRAKAEGTNARYLEAADWARRKGMGEEAVQHARSYALEAERKMGEMLKEKPAAKRQKAGPGRGKKATTENRSTKGEPLFSDDTPTLAELGVSKKESVQAQFLADHPAIAV